MSDKEDMIMLILNNLGKEITFDTNERIESYFAAEDSSKIEYECRRFLN